MEKMKPLLHEAAMGWMNRNYKTVPSMATICSTGWPKILIVRALNYRRIYLVYPQLGTEIGSYLHNNSLGIPDASGNSIWQSVTAKLQTSENQSNEIWQSAITKLEEWSTPADWSRRISSSANTVSSCRLRTISSNTCWRTSRKRNSRN